MQSTLYLECTSERTPEEILCSRNQSRKTSALAKCPHHWSNIPSGSEYQREFELKYPGMKSGGYKRDYEKSFPYEKLRPAPQKPTSGLLLYSNTKIYSNSQTNTSKN